MTALFALGFRPFYLLAAAFAVLAVPVWALVFAGVLPPPLPGFWWHAHEMLFGFAAAVIVGFLLTAGKAWTGLDTPGGARLAALALLWLLGRVAMALGGGVWAAVVDTAFLPVAAAVFLAVLVRAGSRRNYFIGALLAVLALVNLGFHLARLGVVALDPLTPLHVALALVVLLETIVGGRVIPLFTANKLKGVRQWRHKPFDYLTVGVTGVALLLWATGAWFAPLAVVAAALQLVRAAGWNPWATRRDPLLWVLHVSHLWIPIGLGLLAASAWGALPRSAGVHALAIGATGGLIIGMVTRTALGHTGRPLAAGRVETAAYVLVQVAALARVLTVAFVPAAVLGGVHAAATAWALAFVLYLWRYAPFLTRPRADGKPG